jgi:alkanesulfonate monooxygenase SsuD/methylene tetrahydromethanopterin reductase-like flavin-dependent oxidoreductase (luciferase family)
MELGLFMMPLHPPARVWADTLAEDRECLILADKAGFSEAFIGEHLTDKAETIPSCMMFIASVMHATERIKFATGTANLAQIHPAIIAANAAMLDHMLQGRFIFGISPGAVPSDSEILGLFDADRGAMFAEAIDMILALWTQDPPYDFAGTRWQVTTRQTHDEAAGIGILRRPFQAPHPEIVGSVVAPFSPGIVKMGERGFHPASANLMHPAWLAGHWQAYAEGAAKAGRQADPKEWRVVRNIFVADDEATARAYGRDAANSPYRLTCGFVFKKLAMSNRLMCFKSRADQPDDEITLDRVVDDLGIVGTVDSVVDQILELHENVGPFGTLLYACMDWTDPALARRSMELMGEQVMPRVNAALGE